MSSSTTRKAMLKQIWEAAIVAVAGKQAVINALATDQGFSPDLVVAVGKAAAGMCSGALEVFPGCEALVVTKYDHSDSGLRNQSGVEVIESAHPIPDQNSLDAGRRLLERVGSMPADSRLLLLVSGGASALAEALPDEMRLEDLQAITDEMIATGKTIAEINARRKQASRIKDGKLVAAFRGAEIRVYAISDVEGDDIGTIGSGLGDCHRATALASTRIVASNQIARARAEQMALTLNFAVKLNRESLYGDVFELVPAIDAILSADEPGVYIWGGEPTILLPARPGRGGRNQSLALALAEKLVGRGNISVLVAGTDGTDGPTNAAGGIVDCHSWGDSDAARLALQNADAGTYLEQKGALFVTGPTSTNVMDLVIAIID